MDFQRKTKASEYRPELSAGLLLKLLLFFGFLLSLILFFAPQPATASVAATKIAMNEPVNEEWLETFSDTSILDKLFGEGVDAFQSGNYENAVLLWQSAAEQGHAKAQYNLGVAYSRGIGTMASMNQAIKWWHHAALQGSTDAQYNLGLIYSQGRGVEKNLVLAAKWWHMAATGGDAAAQFNLGVIYATGDGVSQNLEEAVRWWHLSAGQGFEQAIRALEVLESHEVLTSAEARQ